MTHGPRAPRVLLVSYWFAPFSTMASIRATKLARHLVERGFEVRVLTAEGTDDDQTLAVEIPRDAITYTSWDKAGHRLSNVIATLRGKRVKSQSHETQQPSPVVTPEASEQEPSKLRVALRSLYRNLIEWPDSRIGWRKHAVAAGLRLIGDWRPDVIYASAPPATTLLVADDLSRKARIPWVAELRDLWTDNPYYNYAAVRRDFERSWEKGVLGRTAAIVTVSPGWRRRLADRHGKPVAVAMNGFVATDFPFAPPADPETSGPLRIVFTGHVYAGYRDPSPLFEALQRLRASANDVVVEFIGTKDKDGALDALAKQYGLSDHVRVLPPVSYKQALDYQLRADVLLHMQWCDPKEQGTIAGKIFDYLGARRPILGIALEDCVVADLVHERKAGLVTNDPQKIAAQVERWIAEKRAGGVKPLPPAASEGLDRAAQFDKLVDLLKSVAAKR